MQLRWYSLYNRRIDPEQISRPSCCGDEQVRFRASVYVSTSQSGLLKTLRWIGGPGVLSSCYHVCLQVATTHLDLPTADSPSRTNLNCSCFDVLLGWAMTITEQVD